MKKLAVILLLMASQTSFASSFGKFKLTIAPSIYDGEQITFLMNSQGEINVIENYDYYDLSSSQFFGETSLDIQSAGDEDFIKGRIVLVDNKITMACAAFIDLKNEYVEGYSADSLILERWNKETKSYQKVSSLNTATSEEKCLNDLLENYSDLE